LAGEWVKIRRRLWSAGQVVIVLGIVGAVVYWAQFAPLPVSVHVVQRGEIVAEVMGTGTLESHISATVSPKISGLITEVAIDQGDRVQRGQVLVRLHDADLGRQVEVAQSSVAAAQAAVSRQEADLARAVAVLDLARYDFDVIQNLLQQGTGSATEFEDARKTLRVSEAELARAEAALAEARKQVIAAEKTLEFQKAKLADTVVSAPFDGLIARRDRDPGDVIVPGSSVLLLVATDEMWISAWVDESEMGRLSVGQPARVVYRSEPQRAYPGEVARLGREVDRETREFIVDVRVRELPPNWAVGQRAEVYIETGRTADAVRLPTHLIVWRNGQSGTFVDGAGRAVWRPLQLGLRGRELVEIAEGLSASERVIAPADAKSDGLKPGQRITSEASEGRVATRGQP
jgi:RND family efflux transporter MFP subunit